MQFRNTKTGNVLTVTDAAVIEMYKSQPDLYRPLMPLKAAALKADKRPAKRKSAKD